MSLGRVFQKVEAATENERRPTVDRRYERVDFFGTLCITFIYWTRCDILPGQGVYCDLGLRACSWPGRSQVITGPGVTYYLDGAHTVDSIQVRCCLPVVLIVCCCFSVLNTRMQLLLQPTAQ